MVQSQEVVITGVGVVSPIGTGKQAFWTSLREGRGGVRPLVALANADLPVPFGAELVDFEPKQYVTPRKSLKVMCREIQTGFSAAVLALADAELDTETVAPERFGVVFGSEMFYGELPDVEDVYRNCLVDGKFDYDRWGERAMSDVFPLWMLKYLPNMVACHLAIAQNALGPNNTISIGEASSLLALIEAANVIQRGHADVVITGGTGSRLNLTSMMYRGDSNLSHRADDPAAASRPFEASRDGMVNGEGAAAFILERSDFAKARRATPLARVLGFGSAFETRLDGSLEERSAIRNSIRNALRAANVMPQDIGHVNAHGVSTVNDDKVEAQAINFCLGDVPVTAPKSFFGNLGAGGGAVEMAASVIAIEHGEVPVTLNYDRPDPECPVNVVHGKPYRSAKPTALVLNQSGTGQTVAVLLAAP
jgi:3-oxoacyl-[acyl-carrier-protein] synthase II